MVRTLALASLVACTANEGPGTAPVERDVETPEVPPKPAPEVAHAAEPPAPPTVVETPPTEPDPPAELPEVVPTSIPGLPPASEGKPIRLTSLEIGERVVGTKKKVPTVAIPDAASRQRLDELIEKWAQGRCKVVLALASLVSMRCVFRDAMSETTDHFTTHFRVGAAGDVEVVEEWSLLHPGLTTDEWIRLLVYNPEADARMGLFTKSGLELSSSRLVEEEDVMDRRDWRSLTPYVRADGPLGPVLAAEGLALAPVGTTMPALPTPTPAIWDTDADTLATTWVSMPAALRAKARLVTPGGRDAAALVFAPGVTSRDLASHGKKVGEGYFVEPATKLVLARAKETISVRVEPGPKTQINVVLPPGTLLPVAIGTVDRTRSGLDAQHWSFIGGWPHGSWVAGRSLEPAERCIRVDAKRGNGGLLLHGIADWTNGGTSRPIMWLAYYTRPSEAVEIHVHPLDGCSLGERTRTLAIGRQLAALHFVPTTAVGGDTLMVVGVANDRYSDRRTVLVFGPSGDEPIVRHEVADGKVDVGVTRGPDGTPGYFPLVLGSGEARTWFQWSGTELTQLAT